MRFQPFNELFRTYFQSRLYIRIKCTALYKHRIQVSIWIHGSRAWTRESIFLPWWNLQSSLRGINTRLPTLINSSPFRLPPYVLTYSVLKLLFTLIYWAVERIFILFCLVLSMYKRKKINYLHVLSIHITPLKCVFPFKVTLKLWFQISCALQQVVLS